MCAKKQGLAAGFHGWLAVASRQIVAHVPSMPEAEASRQLFIAGQKSQAGQAVCSRLDSFYRLCSFSTHFVFVIKLELVIFDLGV